MKYSHSVKTHLFGIYFAQALGKDLGGIEMNQAGPLPSKGSQSSGENMSIKMKSSSSSLILYRVRQSRVTVAHLENNTISNKQ